jgi:DNA modification methylase
MSQSSQVKKINPSMEEKHWTSKQKALHSLHYTVSYRASFKPELPEFFINKYLGGKNKTVLDPFGGRGTTILQSNIMGHAGIQNDINPLSLFIGKANQYIPSLKEISEKLDTLNLKMPVSISKEEKETLLPFFHLDTLKEIINLKNLVLTNTEDKVLQFIGLIALSRLHGHSNGFFSVYTFPQISITPESQTRNNIKRNQIPDYREIKSRILQKAKKTLKDKLPPFYNEFSKNNRFTNDDSRNLKSVKENSVDLVVTSPPFLDKVDYLQDNWMRMWFLNISRESTKVSMFSSLDDWKNFMGLTLKELSRVVKKNSCIIIEVGEVSKGKKIINLDEIVIDSAVGTSLEYLETTINGGSFTKLANCWGASNNEKGTNSNRCVVFKNTK